jgi:hypothetical protein
MEKYKRNKSLYIALKKYIMNKLYSGIISTSQKNQDGSGKIDLLTSTYIYINIHNIGCKHFWHFIMGEFLQVISIICETNATNITLNFTNRIINSSIFDRFYMDICANRTINIKLINSNEMIQTKYNIEGRKWDWEININDYLKIINSIEWLKKETIKYKAVSLSNEYRTKTHPHCLIQLRKDNKELTEFHKKCTIKNIIENPKEYGSQRRNVTGLEYLQNRIFDDIQITSEIVTNDLGHIYDQIYPYINKSNIILVHGAGMFFTLFMNDKSNVVELITRNKMWEKGSAQGLKMIGKIKSFNIEHIFIENKQDIFNNKVIVKNDQGSYLKEVDFKSHMINFAKNHFK